LDGCAHAPSPAAAKGTLAGGYFKERCAMGFQIEGSVYSDWTDAVKEVVGFRGEIIGRPDLTAPAGRLILRITAGNATYPKDKYTVVFWRDFTGAAVAKRVAFKAGVQSWRDTAAEAEAEFTEANGYFEHFCCPYATRHTGPRLDRT
jgi:hypothetical protein